MWRTTLAKNLAENFACPNAPLFLFKRHRSFSPFITGDVQAHINLTIELVPEWISSIQIKKGKYLKIDKNMDLQVITDKINNIVKGKNQ